MNIMIMPSIPIRRSDICSNPLFGRCFIPHFNTEKYKILNTALSPLTHSPLLHRFVGLTQQSCQISIICFARSQPTINQPTINSLSLPLEKHVFTNQDFWNVSFLLLPERTLNVNVNDQRSFLRWSLVNLRRSVTRW